MTLSRLGIVLAIFVINLVGCAESLSFDPTPFRKPGDALDGAIQNWMASKHIPGLALAIVKEGQLSEVRTYGLADVKNVKTVQPDTAFWLASVSKPVLATAVMMLMEEGKLHLDDPVNNYLAQKPLAWKNLTLRHLLSHSSGIPSILSDSLTITDIRLFDTPLIRYEFDPTGDHSEQEVLHVLAQQPLLFAPGTREGYSNSNFVLLAMVIHKVTCHGALENQPLRGASKPASGC